MATIKNLKKDINFLSDEVIGNCFLQYYFAEENKRKEINKIIEEIVTMRNDLIKKVNNPPKDIDNKEKKSYFRNIQEELIKKANDAFAQLEQQPEK